MIKKFHNVNHDDMRMSTAERLALISAWGGDGMSTAERLALISAWGGDVQAEVKRLRGGFCSCQTTDDALNTVCEWHAELDALLETLRSWRQRDDCYYPVCGCHAGCARDTDADPRWDEPLDLELTPAALEQLEGKGRQR